MTDEILVNGIIDCFFIENNSGVLIDYKSDRIYDEEDLKARYRIQLELYRTALERGNGDFHSGDLSLFLCDGEGILLT